MLVAAITCRWDPGPGRFLDAVGDPASALSEDPADAFPPRVGVASSGLLGDSGSHSKTSGHRNSEDVYDPPLSRDFRGFSSFSLDPAAETPIDHAWVRSS